MDTLKSVAMWLVQFLSGIAVLGILVFWSGTLFAQPMDPAMPAPEAGLRTQPVETGLVDGRPGTVRRAESLHAGVFVPDGAGGYVWAGSREPMMMPDAALADARELRLFARELADQVFASASREALQGMIALPASFVSQDDFRRSSAFGRYLAEQMFYELNQRGMPVREYRALGQPMPSPGQGEFALSRDPGDAYGQYPNSLLLVGTYYHDQESVLVNARLLRAVDGMVVGTGSVVLRQSPTTRTMLAKTGVRLEPTYVGIKDFEEVTRASDLTAIDLGDDLH